MPSILALVVLFTVKLLEVNRVDRATDKKLKVYYYSHINLILLSKDHVNIWLGERA